MIFGFTVKVVIINNFMYNLTECKYLYSYLYSMTSQL